MKQKTNHFLLLLILIITVVEFGISQVQHGIHNGNKIHTEFWNYGSISRGGTSVHDLEWDGLGYSNELGLILTAEVEVPENSHLDAYMKLDANGQPVVDSQGNIVWMARIISDGMRGFGSEISPDGSELWGWQGNNDDITNYNIPMSNQEMNWPTLWQTWPGKYGDGITLANQESVYTMDDANNNEFEFYPVSSDSSIRGLGLTVECRMYQFDDPWLDDCLIMTYEITNIGDEALMNVQAGFIGDPHIGGRFNWQDDLSFYNIEHNIAYVWDEDGVSDVPGVQPGYFGIKLLEVPDDAGLGSFSAPPFGGLNNISNDDYYWSNYLQPGTFDDSNAETAGDNIFSLSTGMFNIESNETKTFSSAIVFGTDYDNLIQNSIHVADQYIKRIQSYPTIQHDVSLTYPTYNQTISGVKTIQWTSTSETGNTLLIDLYIKSNNGGSWQLIADSLIDNGSYSWNSENYSNGYNYQMMIYAYDEDSYGIYKTDYFMINNPSAEANIEILLLEPESFPFEMTYSDEMQIKWRAGNADGTDVTINLLIDTGLGWEYIAENETNDGLYILDTKSLPNGSQYQLKLEATDGIDIVSSKILGPITISNDYDTIIFDQVVHQEGVGTGSIIANIVNPNEITGHTYELSFNDSPTSYNVVDIDNNAVVLENISISNNADGPYFGGIRLTIDNDDLEINDERTGWSENSATNLLFSVEPFYDRYPGDFEIRFSDELVDSCGWDREHIKTNFQIFETTDSTQVVRRSFVVTENASTTDSLWNPGERISILLDSLNTSNSLSWNVFLNYPENEEVMSPTLGDVFKVKTHKPFSSQDVFHINTNTLNLENSNLVQPTEYKLFQNYPNPFNPITNIQYEISIASDVSIMIYDILGRNVWSYHASDKPAGNYSIRWNGINNKGQLVSTGVYLTKIQAGSFSKTIKMVYLK